VLINLLSNAIKYNRENGTVEVTCSAISPDRVRVSVADAGQGLAPEQMAQLFQPFNRLGQEAGGEEGTGIGLVVAKRLVELMGGVIGMESSVGVGSVFWFELISAVGPHISMDGPETATHAQSHISSGTHSANLLYIEDNPANLKLIEQIIARQPDINLLTAVDGNSGVEIARASMPDVVLTDINLPDIDGFEVLNALRSDPITAQIPVVAISANAMPLDITRGLEAGFFRYLTKPIKVKKFEDTLELALSMAREIGASAVGVPNVHQAEIPVAETIEPLVPDIVTPLPDDLVMRLQEAALNADYDQLLLLTDEVEQFDRHKSEQFKHYMEAFDYQSVLDVLQTGVIT
jgi:CheY-like chemotaxis protein